MIVTFRPTINTASATDVTACYMNFLRCVTAIATAAAGTTSLTVNPFTASNAIDTTKNCIISIDNNTEAGGWLTSASHNVIASLTNTPAVYTALSAAATFLYKADFYSSVQTGKSAYPYKKLCFHSYNTYATTQGWNPVVAMDKASITANKGHNMLITYGCSSTTDWTSTTFPPQSTSIWNNQTNGQTTSFTLGANTVVGIAAGYNKPGLCYTDTSVEYHMAVTADYCIIWESKVGDTYATGYFTTDTAGNGTTYWNVARQGSIFYMGTRETQPWENSLSNNPPWVSWQHTQDTNGTGIAATPFAHNQVAAFMATNSSLGVVQDPTVCATTGRFDADLMHQGHTTQTGVLQTTPSSNGGHGSRLDGPIFQTKAMGSPQTISGEYLASNNMLYMPQADATTGTQVPGAYPIKISRSFTSSWNQGGNCRGIYKSLSMPYATMKLYWQAANQTFTIGGDTYIPIVLNEDMWLVRFA